MSQTLPIPSRKLPPKATMMYGIGAQKAGTTWLYDLLRQSPECHFAPIKELHYFDVMYLPNEQQIHRDRVETLHRLSARVGVTRGPEQAILLARIADLARQLHMFTDAPDQFNRYLGYLLQGYSGQKVVCDITPAYATLNTIIYRKMALVGPSKFVFIMRDPVDRLWSQIRMGIAARLGAQADQNAFEAACVAEARRLMTGNRISHVRRADYTHTLRKLADAVPAEDRLILFYEHLFRQETADRLCDFLGIARLAADAGHRSNTGRASSLPAPVEQGLYKALKGQYAFVEGQFGPEIPEAWRARMMR